jgi:hypothetical protein
VQSVERYCPTRKQLEEQIWFFVSELSNLTTRLCHMAGGKDPREFLEVQSRCVETKALLTESRYRLAAHNKEHHC